MPLRARHIVSIASAIACIALAIALVFAYVPYAPIVSIGAAWAAEDESEGAGNSDGAGDSDGSNDDGREGALADQAAADAVAALIDALPEPTSAVGSDVSAAENAKAAFDALSSEQQALVSEDRVSKLGQVLDAAERARQAEAEAGQNPGSHGSDEPGNPGDEPGGDAGEDPGGPGDEPTVETYYVQRLLLKWDKPDDDGVTHFVGDSAIVERAYKQISINQFGETVQLNGYYLSTDDTETIYQTADSSTTIGSFELDWRSSDESIAIVTPSGLVKPQGKNGEVVITATVADPRVYQGDAPSMTVTVVFDGQDGKYVTKVEILDENGDNIGEESGETTVYSEENSFHQLHARVTWRNVVDGTETTEVTGSGESYDAHAVGTTLTWSVSASNTFSINEDTGRLRCGSYSGNAYVTCTAIGGLGGAEVSDTANVQLDTGVYEYNPADSLELKVVWEERPDEVVKEATYSYDDLVGMLPARNVNATIVSGDRYGVISAEGFLFKDVVALVAVDDADVLQYRFSTADGYDNPVSYKYLFESGNRYYFPNYEIGGSRAEGEVVPPLLAYKSTLEWSRSEANPNAALDEGTRFRLVFGCLASGDANTSYQIYYIQGITIVLKGAPSAGRQDGDDPEPEPPADDNKDDPKPDDPAPDAPAPDGGWQQVGPGGASGGGSGQSGTVSSGTGGAARSGNIEGANGNGQPQGASGESATENAEEAADDSGDDSGDEGDDAAGADASPAKRWRVYQMMNKTNSDVPDWDDENPISPFALPAVLGTFAVGIGATGVGFRRRLR